MGLFKEMLDPSICEIRNVEER
ncbi:Protein of unknown function [Bacillus cereus]|nr:Protein of unknown function [Bacillus cereus]